MYRNSYRRPSGGQGLVAIALVVLLFFGGCAGCRLASRGDVTVKVEDKLTKRDGDSDRYLIYTDKGVFQNTDSLLALKYRSSDMYHELKVGKVYDCRTEGFRIPLFSMYKNLLECEEVVAR